MADGRRHHRHCHLARMSKAIKRVLGPLLTYAGDGQVGGRFGAELTWVHQSTSPRQRIYYGIRFSASATHLLIDLPLSSAVMHLMPELEGHCSSPRQQDHTGGRVSVTPYGHTRVACAQPRALGGARRPRLTLTKWGGGGGGIAAWAPPPDPPLTHVRKVFPRKKMKFIKEARTWGSILYFILFILFYFNPLYFRHTNISLASDPPPPPHGMGHGRH